MLFTIITNPAWIAAIAGVVMAIFAIPKFFLDILMVIDKNKHNNKLKPWLKMHNLKLFRRSTMKGVFKVAKRLSQEMKDEKYIPTLIAFIGRGGSIFGSLISYNLNNVPVFCVDRKYEENKVYPIFPITDIDIPQEYLQRVLIVAGEVHTGNTIDAYIEQFKTLNDQSDIRTCTFFKQKNCKKFINYVGIEEKDSILMPWQDKDFIRESTINLD